MRQTGQQCSGKHVTLGMPSLVSGVGFPRNQLWTAGAAETHLKASSILWYWAKAPGKMSKSERIEV